MTNLRQRTDSRRRGVISRCAIHVPMPPIAAIGKHDAELLQAEPERIGVQAQSLGRGVCAADAPARLLQDGFDVRALDRVEFVPCRLDCWLLAAAPRG